MQNIVTRVSSDSFREKATGKKVVLIYPWTNYRNLYLTHFLSNSAEGFLYYRIPHDIDNLSEWLQALADELHSVMDGFGKNTNAALANGGEPSVLGEALAADLGDAADDQLTLFIDELDRIPFDEDFNIFARSLVAALPPGTQIAFSSRLLVQQPWSDMVNAGEAVILGTERRKNDVRFTVEQNAKPQVEVYGFGRGHVLVNGKEITNWDGALPRNLFFYFVDNPLVTRDDIFAVFWPKLTVKEATNVFHVTKRKISERVSLKVDDGENYEMTIYASGFYMPGDKVVRHYDVAEFQEAVERATNSSDQEIARKLYQQAVDLYKGPFLETIPMQWVENRRFVLQQLYAQALIGLGRIHDNMNDHEQALGYYTRALKETPGREDIHREVMQLYIKLNMPEDARNQFEHLKKYLAEAQKASPAPETVAIIETIEAEA